MLLHRASSSSPVASRAPAGEKVNFYYFYVYKDLQGLLLVALALCVMVLLYPNLLNHPDNFIEANALATPAHIVPE